MFKKPMLALMLLALPAGNSFSQDDPFAAEGKRFVGSAVDSSVDQIFDAGLKHLAQSQNPDGSWSGQDNTTATALACLCFLARGEDANHGPYASNIRKGLKYVISQQNSKSGYIGHSMYVHGFCTMALAECYGMVHVDKLGIATEKAVQLLLKSQAANALGGWRYSPGDTSSADTSINGACLVALLAARNAGLEVPEKSIDRCLKYYENCQDESGSIGYASRGGGSPATTAIGGILYFYAKRHDSEVARKALAKTIENVATGARGWHSDNNGYAEYYIAQTLFQGDMNAWGLWNKSQVEKMRDLRYERNWKARGSDNLPGVFTLLSLALNYRYLPIYER